MSSVVPVLQLRLVVGVTVNLDHLYHAIADTPLQKWLPRLPEQLATEYSRVERHGIFPKWQQALELLPSLPPSTIDLSADCVRVGVEEECDENTRRQLEWSLRELCPWRKGPYSLYGVEVDCEWRSDRKWRRLEDHIQPLAGRLVLDVGCGNGYHCWRMAGAGASPVIGIDPHPLYLMQYRAIYHFVGDEVDAFVLPLALEAMPPKFEAFDTVFSMGVLYHRRSPFDHLFELHSCLRRGGELVLETLVIEGGRGQVLVPEGRYARMRNVWFIPSCLTLESWLRRCGYEDIRCIDVTATTPEEQRSTPWMEYESLAACLDPRSRKRTVEGYPAPRRAIFLASKKKG